MLQVEAQEILKTGSNVFLTGVPGAGKSYVVNQYVKWLEDKGIYPAITASTGIASTHIGGQTIHSFSGIGIEKFIDDYKLDRILEREKLVKKIQNTKVLIIDEISMLDAQTLDNVDKVLRGVKDPTKAFGGIQIIFVGDFFQLPPVVKRGEEQKYFAFMSRAWKEAKPLVCYLEEQYRQSDETFSKLLLAIRENNIDDMHVEILEDLKKKTFEKFGWDLPKQINDGEWVEEEIQVEYTGPIPNPSPSGKGTSYLTSDIKNYDSLKLRALEMRKLPTQSENLLWEKISDNKLGAHFRRQHIIENFIVDFVCLKKKLIIEVDGEIHNSQQEKDSERDSMLAELGYQTMRFTNEEIQEDLDFVIDEIKSELEVLPEGEDLGGAGDEKGLGDSYDILELHSHNKNVDEINEAKLKKISGREFVFKMLVQGKSNLVESLIKSCLSPEILKLKIGAKVIFTKNSLEGEYVNGTLGEVVELESFKIVVETKEGKRINLKQEEWKYEDDGKVHARISQYPLRLAWAITVHKSQGMSLDEAIINLGETFEFGQGYVALSRLRNLDGLYLKSYNPKSLQVNGHISEYDEKIRKDSRFIQNKFLKADMHKLEKLQKDFVEKCSGVWSGGVVKKEKELKKDTYEQTFELIKSGKTFEQIMSERDMSSGTIISHVEHLLKHDKLTKLEVEKIVPETVKIFNIPNEVKKSFKKNKIHKDEDGKIKLAPIFKDLKEKYSYDELRWYRLFV